MKVAIFGKDFKESFNDAIYKIFELLNKNGVYIQIYKNFFDFITKNLFFQPHIDKFFLTKGEIDADTDLIISIGGDGTFLECVAFMKKSEIPFVGINSGRLGFLASISKEEITSSIEKILKKDYLTETRTVLEASIETNIFNDNNFAMNELTISKKDNSSMINIEVYLNGAYLNTYWADGIIVATPTGSTAYSLSTGGPIIMPGAQNFVITPIAPHTLTVRPLIVSNDAILEIIVKGRGEKFIAALDSKFYFVDYETKIAIKKADFSVKTLKFEESDFFSILRKKLMWGLDIRN